MSRAKLPTAKAGEGPLEGEGEGAFKGSWGVSLRVPKFCGKRTRLERDRRVE
jgi:hypothetical protein